jgi:hypothetical protein
VAFFELFVSFFSKILVLEMIIKSLFEVLPSFPVQNIEIGMCGWIVFFILEVFGISST